MLIQILNEINVFLISYLVFQVGKLLLPLMKAYRKKAVGSLAVYLGIYVGTVR